MAQKLIWYLLIGLLFLFPFGELFRFQIANDIAITVNDVWMGLLAIITISYLIYKKHKFGTQNIAIYQPILFFIVICAISLGINSIHLQLSQVFVASLYLIRWISYASLISLIFLFSQKEKRQIIRYITIAGTGFVLIGYVQYAFYQNLRNLFYLGWDEHLYRLFSSFLDPNFAGIFLVMFFFFLLGITVYMYQKKTNIYFFVCLFLSFFTLGSIFLTYSRSALLGLIIGGIIFLILHKKTKFVILFLFIFSVFILLSQLLFKSEGTNLLRTTSTLSRINTASNALFIIKRNPIIGVGFDAYRYAQERYGLYVENTSLPNHAAAGTDNSFLFVIATTGVIGFIAFLYLLFRVYTTARTIYAHREGLQKELSIIFLASFGSLLVSSLFNNNLFYPFLMEWMWIEYALTVSM